MRATIQQPGLHLAKLSFKSPPRHQRGAVLVVSLLILVALTLIGISAVNTGQLEQKMATSNQEVMRSFQDAESVLTSAFTSGDLWSVGKSECSVDTSAFVDADKVAGTSNYGRTQSCFIGFAPIPEDSLWSDQFQIANFDFEGHSQTESQIETRIHLGG